MANYSTFSPEVLKAMPVLFPNDVAETVAFVLMMPSHVLVRYFVILTIFFWLKNMNIHFLGTFSGTGHCTETSRRIVVKVE